MADAAGRGSPLSPLVPQAPEVPQVSKAAGSESALPARTSVAFGSMARARDAAGPIPLRRRLPPSVQHRWVGAGLQGAASAEIQEIQAIMIAPAVTDARVPCGLAVGRDGGNGGAPADASAEQP